MNNLLIVDYNSLFIRLATGLYASNKDRYGMDLIRSAIMTDLRNSINGVNAKDVVFTMEGDRNQYWKKDVYPHYKFNRTIKRDTGIDFSEVIYPFLEALSIEIKNELPFPMLRNIRCESDDIIASIVFHKNTVYDKIFILTMDSDFEQLVHKYSNVYTGFPDSIKREFTLNKLKNENMIHKIIKGSPKDFIPNAYSDDEFLYIRAIDETVEGRQKSVTKKILEQIGEKPKMKEILEVFPHFKRNYSLMAMINIPEDVQKENCLFFDMALSEVDENKNLTDYLTKYKIQ